MVYYELYFDPERMLRYGLGVIFKNEEGPSSLAKLNSALFFNKGMFNRTMRPTIRSHIYGSIYGFHIFTSDYLASSPRIKFVKYENPTVLWFKSHVMNILHQLSTRPGYYVMLSWAFAVPGKYFRRPGVIRPWLRLITREYDRASESENPIFALGGRHVDEKALMESPNIIVGPPFGMATLSLKEIIIVATWIDRSWYADFLERQLTRNVNGGKVEEIKLERGDDNRTK
jgi:hypothetical protein